MKKVICLMLIGLVAASLSAQVQRSNLTIMVQPTNDGWWTRYRFFAAEEWRTDAPERGKDWKIIGEYPMEKLQFLNFYDGRFRNAAGSVQSNPTRWAYLRFKEDRWDGQKWILPDGTAYMPAKIPLDGTVLQLMQAYSKRQIMDSMDKFVGIDGPGAPEK